VASHDVPTRRTLRPDEIGAGGSRGSIRHVTLHQPRSHGPGAGQLSPPGTSRLAFRTHETRDLLGTASVSRHRTRDESFAPTRSARTPHVAQSRRTRWRVWCSAAAVANAPKRAGTVRLRDHAAQTLELANERERRAHVAPRANRFRGSRRTGPRAASPEPPRRSPRSAAPEVPSIEEPPRRGRPGFRPGFARQVGPSPQVVTNLWRTRGAVALLADSRSGPAALTGCRRRGLGLGRRRSGRSPPSDAVGRDSTPAHDARAGLIARFYPERSLVALAQTHSAPIDFYDRNDPRLGNFFG